MKCNTERRRSFVRACFFLTIFIFASPSQAQDFSQIVAFGDSWTDPVATAPDGPSYAYVLSGLLNIPIDNNAVSGATTTAINRQISDFLNGGVDPDALYIYWAVGNDFLEPGGRDDTSVTNNLMATNAAAGIDMLIQAGAQHFLIFNSIDNGLRPISIANGEEAEATAVSIEYNQLMKDVLVARNLRDSLFDSFSFFSDLVLDGRFTNISIGCFSIGCSNPDEFVWWDNIHPSATSHSLIAAGAFAQLTAPAGSSRPEIISVPPTSATVGTNYGYDVDATDSDLGSVITYSLINAPPGMTVNSQSGIISWIPVTADIGANTVAVLATDNTGLADTQGFTIDVIQQSGGGGGVIPPTSQGGGGSTGWLTMLFMFVLALRTINRKIGNSHSHYSGLGKKKPVTNRLSNEV